MMGDGAVSRSVREGRGETRDKETGTAGEDGRRKRGRR